MISGSDSCRKVDDSTTVLMDMSARFSRKTNNCSLKSLQSMSAFRGALSYPTIGGHADSVACNKPSSASWLTALPRCMAKLSPHKMTEGLAPERQAGSVSWAPEQIPDKP